MLTDEQIDKAREVARKTYNHSRAQVRGQMMTPSDDPEWHFARAIESAACADRDARIAELERELEAVRKDAERWVMSHLVSKEALTPPEQRQHQNVLNAYFTKEQG